MLVKSVLYFFLCAWPVSQVLAESPAVVYRGDTMSPHDMKQQGGFQPKGMDMARRPFDKFASTSLYDHVNGDNRTGQAPDNSGYVSCSSDINVARRAVQSYGGSGWIYFIRPSSNFIDADGSLGRYHPRPEYRENEYSALWGIDFRQVMGWIEIVGGAEMGYTPNPDFNATTYIEGQAGGVHPELAGFVPAHVAWLEHPWRDYTNCNCDHQAHERRLAEELDERTSSPMIQRADDQCYPTESAPDFAADYLASKTLVHNLWVTIKLCDKDNADAPGNITVYFGRRPYRTSQRLLTAPNPAGEQKRFRVNVPQVPGGMSVSRLSPITLRYDPPVTPQWNKRFKLQGMLLEADIGTYRGLVNDKFSNLHKWLRATNPLPEVVYESTLEIEEWWQTGGWENPQPDYCAA